MSDPVQRAIMPTSDIEAIFQRLAGENNLDLAAMPLPVQAFLQHVNMFMAHDPHMALIYSVPPEERGFDWVYVILAACAEYAQGIVVVDNPTEGEGGGE